MLKLMDWADTFSKGEGKTHRAFIRKIIEDPNEPYHGYMLKLLKEVDPDVLTTTAVNFFINANLIGRPLQEELRKKYNCNIPWAILLDPTSACNLHCTGC